MSRGKFVCLLFLSYTYFNQYIFYHVLFPQRQESFYYEIPAFAGMTYQGLHETMGMSEMRTCL